jgi:2Fe-2S ferredoxin
MNITIHLRKADGRALRIPGRRGQTLMQAAVAAGVHEIAADCGGLLSCATCHVFVDAPWLERLAPPSVDEASMLELTATPRQPDSRLSCQLVLDDEFDGLAVRLPARQD